MLPDVRFQGHGFLRELPVPQSPEPADKEVRGLACRWRIRYKLLIGLVVVIGILAMVVAGTLKGLTSYEATVNTFDSKLVEQNAVRELKRAVTSLTDLKGSMAQQPEELRKRAAECRQQLGTYQEKLQETLAKRRDDANGFMESQLIEALRERLNALDQAIEQASDARVTPGEGSQSILEDARVKEAIVKLTQGTDDLYGRIYENLWNRIDTAKRDRKASMIVVLSSSIFGVLLMVGLLRFFYRWTFNPLRDLQAGVGKIAQGDFGHTIEVHSGDEMEELAGAFNHMTHRLNEMYRDLARQVNERSRQLVRSERLAGVGFLAAGVAHEINNPLASIAFCSEALEGRLKDILKDRQAKPAAGGPRMILEFAAGQAEDDDQAVITKYLKMIQDEAFRCKQITQRLLEFSRGGERRREPTDLGELIQSVLDMVQHLQSSKGKKIVFTGQVASSADWNGTPPARLLAWVNAQEIKSVVLNLVVNALDSMDDGGTLGIRMQQHDQSAELVFQDTGCGMEPEVLENIFEPFFTRSRTGKGTGLGLSISHRIISQHGGEIEATSPGPSQGSTFTVRLPLQPVESSQEETAVRHAA